MVRIPHPSKLRPAAGIDAADSRFGAHQLFAPFRGTGKLGGQGWKFHQSARWFRSTCRRKRYSTRSVFGEGLKGTVVRHSSCRVRLRLGQLIFLSSNHWCDSVPFALRTDWQSWQQAVGISNLSKLRVAVVGSAVLGTGGPRRCICGL